MREKILIMVVVGFLVNLCALNVYAQEEEPKGQLFVIHEDVVKPSMVGKYEEATKSVVAKLKANNMTSISYVMAVADDFHYYWISEIENLAALDENPWQELEKKIGEDEMKAMWDGYDDTEDMHHTWLARLRPDLSYTPENAGENSEEMNFRHWDWYYINSGKGTEAKAIAKERHDLYTKKNIQSSYRIFTGGLGTEQPLYVVLQSAKNAADFEANNAKVMELLGEDAQDLMQRTLAITRKFDTKTGWMRPELSYMPSEEVTAKE